MNFPKFDIRYLWIIAAIFWVHLFAVISTAYAIRFMNASEISPVSNFGFSLLGIVPTMALTTLIGFATIMAIPYIVKENATLGKTTVAVYSIIFFLVGIDSLNDFLAVTHNLLHLKTAWVLSLFIAAAPYIFCACIIAMIVLSILYRVVVRLRSKYGEST